MVVETEINLNERIVIDQHKIPTQKGQKSALSTLKCSTPLTNYVLNNDRILYMCYKPNYKSSRAVTLQNDIKLPSLAVVAANTDNKRFEYAILLP